MGSATDISKSS
uniref:Uncharacterized protein n=1 Tax=Anguilla anguilla TaxID=7936 RepID=A0A0E9QXE4_ANGAN